MFPFDPLENIRKPKIFWCFHGYQKGTLGRKRLKVKQKSRLIQSIASQFSICIPPETINFSGGIEIKHWHKMD